MPLKRTKKPWLAGLLNIIAPLGYLYLGKRKGFSYLLIVGWVFAVADGIVNPGSIKYSILGVMGIFSTIVAFVYDAYSMAKNP